MIELPILRCVEDHLNPALRAVSDAVLAVASQLSVDEVLQRLVESARELADAGYAALGIPDGEGGFRHFLVSGMSDQLIAAMGPLPRTHGMLGAMLTGPAPYLTADIHADPRFRGWWPAAHPDMRSFLGVPIVARGEVIGAFYLTEKQSSAAFDEADTELISVLAAHAAIAITNASLYERSRKLSVISERNRLALELHDAVSQKLFSLTLTAQAAATQFDRDPAAARAHLLRLGELAGEALEELRSLILGLRPPELDARRAQRDACERSSTCSSRVHQVDIRLEGDGEPAGADPERDLAILRIVGEAVHNALRHARAGEIRVRLGAHAIEIVDDGRGFDPHAAELRARHLGLTSMKERARELGATLTLDAAPGEGHDRPTGARAMIRVLIVDDHAVVREGLRSFLELQDGIEVAGEAGDGEEAIDLAARALTRRGADGPGDAGPRRPRGDAGAAFARSPRPRHRADELPRG